MQRLRSFGAWTPPRYTADGGGTTCRLSAESEQACTPAGGGEWGARSAEVEAGTEPDERGEPGTGRRVELHDSGAPGMNVKLFPSSVTDVRLYSASLLADDPDAKPSAGGGRVGITTVRRLLGDASCDESAELPRRRPEGGNVDESDASLKLPLRDSVSTTLPVPSPTARGIVVSEGHLFDGTTGPKSRTASGKGTGTDTVSQSGRRTRGRSSLRCPRLVRPS